MGVRLNVIDRMTTLIKLNEEVLFEKRVYDCLTYGKGIIPDDELMALLVNTKIRINLLITRIIQLKP